MPSVRHDHDDVARRAFTARIARRGEHDGRPALELEETWFYPEGGGQPADRGRIGSARVLDVQLVADGTIWHVVDVPPADDELDAEIDAARRFDHMQQHTGQHVLSAAFEHVCGAATLSSTLGAERSVIEVEIADADWPRLSQLEVAANRVLWDDRELRFHWTDAAGVGAFTLRKAPAVTGPIRIVEIPDWDVSACGGTHVRRTGEVGAIKILGWERVRRHVRIEFVCGGRALADHCWRVEALREVARRRSVAERDLLPTLERLADERTVLARELEAHRQAVLKRIVMESVAAHGYLADWAEERTRKDARALVLLAIDAGAPWAVASAAAPAPVVVLARPRGGSPDLRDWLPDLLERTGGRGGGSAELVSIAPRDAAAARAAHAWAHAAFEAHATR